MHIAPAILFLSVLATTVHTQSELQKRDDDPDEIICKYEKVVGSRIPEKICLSRFEWEERKRIQLENKRSSRNNHSSADLRSQP